MIFSSHKKERAFAHLWQLDSPLNKGLCFFKTQHHPPLARLHTQGSAWLLWHAVLVSDLQVLCWWSVSNTIQVSKSPWGPSLANFSCTSSCWNASELSPWTSSLLCLCSSSDAPTHSQHFKYHSRNDFFFGRCQSRKSLIWFMLFCTDSTCCNLIFMTLTPTPPK